MRLVIVTAILLSFSTYSVRANDNALNADLLVVGGTESGCAAAIQAARMGVQSIVLVNDIEWLGGQFSAEALVAIDENRGPAGYDQTVPFPRAGLFKELIDRIERRNKQKYGRARPGNTRVITTCRRARVSRDVATVCRFRPSSRLFKLLRERRGRGKQHAKIRRVSRDAPECRADDRASDNHNRRDQLGRRDQGRRSCVRVRSRFEIKIPRTTRTNIA